MDPSAPCDVDWAANYGEEDHGPLPWPLGIVGPRRQCGFLVEVEVDGGSGCVVDGAVVMAYGEVQSGYVRIDLCGFREVPRPPPGTHLLVKADRDSTGTTLVPTEPAAVAALRPWTPSSGTLPRFGLRYGPRDQPLPELVVCPLAGCDEAVAASWWGEWRARALDWTAHWTCAPTMSRGGSCDRSRGGRCDPSIERIGDTVIERCRTTTVELLATRCSRADATAS